MGTKADVPEKEQAAEEQSTNGYWCVVCGRFLPADKWGVIVHDSLPHPEMNFAEAEVVQ